MSKVSVTKITGQEYEDIKKAVDHVLEDIGGIEDIIKPGYKVIVKPNLVACPTERLSGGVTRWEVCLAIIEAVEAVGAHAIIAESSAAGADTELTIEKCGYQDLRDRGYTVIDLKQKENKPCKVPIENGVVFNEINTWEIVRDCDAVITVPVMKNHDQTEITLGMKNLKGLLSDVQKKEFHKQGLIEGVVDWNTYVKPCLQVVDGTFGQQGLGPIFGETRQMDLILASKDMVACEVVAGKIMGYEPEEVMLTMAAAKRGLGEADINKIEVSGVQIDEVKTRFKRSSEVEIEGIPESFNLIFNDGACTGCHNTVISSLMDMKAQDLFPYLEGMNVCSGPCTKDDLPEDATGENTVCIGICGKKLADEMGARLAIGCPPGNADTVKAILGDRLEYGVRYK